MAFLQLQLPTFHSTVFGHFVGVIKLTSGGRGLTKMAGSHDPDYDLQGTGERKELKKLLTPNVVTAFFAGVLLANFNKNLILGMLVGGMAGVFVEQQCPNQLPNVRESWEDLKRRWRNTKI